jgi:NAD-dependent dihydropyrimidine dehydrogenase PreA subunit
VRTADSELRFYLFLTVLCRRSLGNGGSFEEPVLQTLCPSSGSSHLCLFWLEPEMLNSPRKPIQLKGGTMVRIVIDYDKCAKEKDKICVEICPVSIFRFGKSAKPEAVNVENCIMCRTCQVNCPRQAIEIVF